MSDNREADRYLIVSFNDSGFKGRSVYFKWFISNHNFGYVCFNL